MKKEIKLAVVLIALGTGLFLFLKEGFTQEKPEKLEDYSRYGYTLKYKNPDVYTTEPGKEKSFYHQGEPSLPPALKEQAKPPQWSKPEKLEKVEPRQLYLPPSGEEILPAKVYYDSEEEREAKKELTLERFAEKIKPFMAEIMGKEMEVKLGREEITLVPAVALVEKEKEEEVEEKPQEGLFSDEWRILMKERRFTLKPPGGITQEELDKIAAHLANFLGRGGEITRIGPEGIEIEIR